MAFFRKGDKLTVKNEAIGGGKGVTNGTRAAARSAAPEPRKAQPAGSTMTVNGKTYRGGVIEIRGDGNVYVDGTRAN